MTDLDRGWSTERLDLEPLAVAHAAELAPLLDDASLHEFTGGAPLPAAALAARYARLTARRSPAGEQMWGNWVVRVRATGMVAGTVQATLPAGGPAAGPAEVAWVVVRPAQGRGYGKEAARSLVAWLHEAGWTVVAHIHPGHLASQQVARSAGLSPTADVHDGEIRWVSPPEPRAPGIGDARRLFPATAGRAYFNTAAVGLASRQLAETYRAFIDEWAAGGLNYSDGERAAGESRSAAARLIGADAADVALIPSVSSAAGLVAAQFGPAGPGESIVIGQREYSSNHYPWRLLTGKGYDIRQVPFRNGGLEPDDIARQVDGGTRLVAFSGVQSATGHRSDIAAISGLARAAGAIVFVDGSQLVGAVPVADDLRHVDVLVAPDHKFLLNAGRGMGYCYLSPAAQARFTPVGAGWRAGSVPSDSFFGPAMNLSATASRFDSSISWLAAIGNQAALAVFDDFGPGTIYARNRELTASLRTALARIGWGPADLPARNQSTIVSVPLGDHDGARLLSALSRQGVICSARDGNLRLAVHFYNHEDDIEQLVAALASAEVEKS